MAALAKESDEKPEKFKFINEIVYMINYLLVC